MFRTACNRDDPNFKEVLSKQWPSLETSSATRYLEKEYFMIPYRRPTSNKYMLVQEQDSLPFQSSPGCNRWYTSKYYSKISHSGVIKKLLKNKTYNIMMNSTYQSNTLMYCLESNWCNIVYVWQTRNRITNRYQYYIFDIKHQSNTTVARLWQPWKHCGPYDDYTHPRIHQDTEGCTKIQLTKR